MFKTHAVSGVAEAPAGAPGLAFGLKMLVYVDISAYIRIYPYLSVFIRIYSYISVYIRIYPYISYLSYILPIHRHGGRYVICVVS